MALLWDQGWAGLLNNEVRILRHVAEEVDPDGCTCCFDRRQVVLVPTPLLEGWRRGPIGPFHALHDVCRIAEQRHRPAVCAWDNVPTCVIPNGGEVVVVVVVVVVEAEQPGDLQAPANRW